MLAIINDLIILINDFLKYHKLLFFSENFNTKKLLEFKSKHPDIDINRIKNRTERTIASFLYNKVDIEDVKFVLQNNINMIQVFEKFNNDYKYWNNPGDWLIAILFRAHILSDDSDRHWDTSFHDDPDRHRDTSFHDDPDRHRDTSFHDDHEIYEDLDPQVSINSLLEILYYYIDHHIFIKYEKQFFKIYTENQKRIDETFRVIMSLIDEFKHDKQVSLVMCEWLKSDLIDIEFKYPINPITYSTRLSVDFIKFINDPQRYLTNARMIEYNTPLITNLYRIRQEHLNVFKIILTFLKNNESHDLMRTTYIQFLQQACYFSENTIDLYIIQKILDLNYAINFIRFNTSEYILGQLLDRNIMNHLLKCDKSPGLFYHINDYSPLMIQFMIQTDKKYEEELLNEAVYAHSNKIILTINPDFDKTKLIEFINP